jgi:hypothetical protein
MATAQEATVRHTDGMAFTGTAGSGHIVWMDGAADVGGQNGGFRPSRVAYLRERVASMEDVENVEEVAGRLP